MSFLKDLFAKDSVIFAEGLVEKIVKQFPPGSERMLTSKGGKRRLESILGHIMNDIDKFQESNTLGVLGKARLGNKFRWGLIEKGYSKQFAEALTEGMIKQMVGK